MKQLSLLLIGFFAIVIAGLAQDAGKVESVVWGKVNDAEGQLIFGATVILQSKDENDTRITVATDSSGNFKIAEMLASGYYRLQITYTGYRPLLVDSLLIHEHSFSHDIGFAVLERDQDGSLLDEAVVIANKPLFETKEGTITMNVGAAPMASSSSGADLLRNMPMVGTDPEGRLLVRGKQPIVLIDDKPVEMNGQQLSDLLESLPGSAIEKIELMQNPPPQYAGNEGGVINIVTKKGSIGWMGKFTLSVGTIGQTNGSLNMSYRSPKLTVNITAGSNISRVGGNSYSRRENQYRDSANFFNTDAGFENHFNRPNLRVQVNYDVSPRKQWSAVLQGNGNWYNNHSLTTYTNINRFSEPWKLSQRQNTTHGNNTNIQPQVGYTWFGKNRAEKFQVTTTYGFGTADNDRLFFQQFLNPDFTPNGIDSSQAQRNQSTSHNGSVRVHYQKPLKFKGVSYNTGGALFYNQSHNLLNTFFKDKSTGENVPNDLLSNDFTFEQQVANLRAGLNVRLGKTWRAMTNVQWESTRFGFNFAAPADKVENNYHNWLPSASLHKELSKELNASAVYRKTIRRPGMGELNPAIDYSDPYNLRFGNPLLLPSQSNNFDLNLNWNKGKSFINTSLGFNQVRDIINRIRTLQEDGKTNATFQNVAMRNEYEAGIWSGYSFSKKFRMNVSASYVFNQYGKAEKERLKYRDGSSITTNLNYNYMVNNLLTFDGNFRYNAFADPQGRSRSNVSMQIGGQYKLLDRRLILAAAAFDPFTRQEITSLTQGSNFRIESYRAAITRNYRLSASWVLQKANKGKNSK